MRSLAKYMLMIGPLAAILWAASAYAVPDAWRKEGWTRTDFSKTTVAWGEILSGGPPRDGIPPIDSPLFRSAHTETSLADADPVIALEIKGDARAYPLRILIWHEIVNDTVGGVPVVVTYCPLCNAALVFERTLDRQLLTFGTSGKLRKSDLIMYDRQTESWWQQFLGEAIVGSLAGRKLQLIASRLESFSSFKSRFPAGRVLYPADPTFRTYGRNPYEGYDSSATPFLYQGDLPSGINPMVRVVVVRSVGKVRALTLDLLRRHGRIDFGEFTVMWRQGQASALDKSEIAKGRDVGNVVVQSDMDGRKSDIPYDLTFAFVAHAFHPDIAILESCSDFGSVFMQCGGEKAP